MESKFLYTNCKHSHTANYGANNKLELGQANHNLCVR